jgi:transcriptional regulator with XRE-family HTH domain
MKMYKETFGAKLKQARKKIGYTQREAAQELEIPYSTLANYELGRTEPDIEMIGKLADFYEVSTDWLIGTGVRKYNEETIKLRGKVNDEL